jgi:hypothetical protein
MSLAHLLSINGALHLRPAGPSPYRMRPRQWGRRPVAETVPDALATELRLSAGAPDRTSRPAPDPSAPTLPLWLKVAFLVALLCLCSGVVQVNSVSRQKQIYVLGQELRLREALAEESRWLNCWYRARLADAEQLRAEEIQKYPPPASRVPKPRDLPPPPEEVLPPFPRTVPSPALPAVALLSRPRVPGAGAEARPVRAMPVSYRVRTP